MPLKKLHIVNINGTDFDLYQNLGNGPIESIFAIVRGLKRAKIIFVLFPLGIGDRPVAAKRKKAPVIRKPVVKKAPENLDTDYYLSSVTSIYTFTIKPIFLNLLSNRIITLESTETRQLPLLHFVNLDL